MRMDCKSGPFDRPCVAPRRPNSTNAQTLRHAVASSGRRVSSVSAEDRKSPAAAVHCLRSSGPPRLVGTIAQTPPYPLFASRHRCGIPTTARCAPLATSGETGQFSNLPGDRHLRSPVPRPLARVSSHHARMQSRPRQIRGRHAGSVRSSRTKGVLAPPILPRRVREPQTPIVPARASALPLAVKVHPVFPGCMECAPGKWTVGSGQSSRSTLNRRSRLCRTPDSASILKWSVRR